MSVIIHTPHSRTPIRWASGTSTEIFIYPKGGDFVKRDFIFRISTATVEAEESTFTFFEGITRHLMILKGELDLVHDQRYQVKLKPYDQDVFSGEWPTRSKGRVTDFNLMLKGSAQGELKHYHLVAGASLNIEHCSAYTFIYVAEGHLNYQDHAMAMAGDLLELSGIDALPVTATEKCELVLITVRL